ncbi:MAG: hypothetical protein ABIF77_03730 [bacterium]
MYDVGYAALGKLIAIGTQDRRFENTALTATRRIGKVEVDHGKIGCKTPDAVTYIPKAAVRYRQRQK